MKPKLKIKSLLPDFLTSINVMLALSSVILVMQSFDIQTIVPANYVYAGWMIIIASIIDGLDGKCARWLGKSGNFGVHFDSFADLIVFGFAPSILLYATFFKNFGLLFVPVLAFFVIASAYRLARFNCKAQGNKKTHFEGLPTTSAGGICASMVLMTEFIQKTALSEIDGRILAVTALFMIIALSLLMVSTIRFDTINHFVMRDSHRFVNIAAILGYIVFFFYYPAVALFLVGLFYMVESLFRWYFFDHIEATMEATPITEGPRHNEVSP